MKILIYVAIFCWGTIFGAVFERHHPGTFTRPWFENGESNE